MYYLLNSLSERFVGKNICILLFNLIRYAFPHTHVLQICFAIIHLFTFLYFYTYISMYIYGYNFNIHTYELHYLFMYVAFICSHSHIKIYYINLSLFIASISAQYYFCPRITGLSVARITSEYIILRFIIEGGCGRHKGKCLGEMSVTIWTV